MKIIKNQHDLPPLSEATRQKVFGVFAPAEDQLVIELFHPTTGAIVAGICTPLSWAHVQNFLTAVQSVIVDISERQMNHCECTAEYAALMSEKLQAQASNNSARVTEIETFFRKTWNGLVPRVQAASLAEPPCPVCGRHRQYDPKHLLMDQGFMQNMKLLLDIPVEYEIQLDSLPILLLHLQRSLWNEEKYGEKKKAILAILEQTGILALIKFVFGLPNLLTATSKTDSATIGSASPADETGALLAPNTPLPTSFENTNATGTSGSNAATN